MGLDGSSDVVMHQKSLDVSMDQKLAWLPFLFAAVCADSVSAV
jgi:hypothetical protein